MTIPSDRPSSRGFWGKMFEVSPGWVMRLLIACLVVGLVLAALDIDPAHVWSDFFGTLRDAWNHMWSLSHWAVQYLALGAILVIPVFLVVRFLGALKK